MTLSSRDSQAAVGEALVALNALLSGSQENSRRDLEDAYHAIGLPDGAIDAIFERKSSLTRDDADQIRRYLRSAQRRLGEGHVQETQGRPNSLMQRSSHNTRPTGSGSVAPQHRESNGGSQTSLLDGALSLINLVVGSISNEQPGPSVEDLPGKFRSRTPSAAAQNAIAALRNINTVGPTPVEQAWVKEATQECPVARLQCEEFQPSSEWAERVESLLSSAGAASTHGTRAELFSIRMSEAKLAREAESYLRAISLAQADLARVRQFVREFDPLDSNIGTFETIARQLANLQRCCETLPHLSYAKTQEWFISQLEKSGLRIHREVLELEEELEKKGESLKIWAEAERMSESVEREAQTILLQMKTASWNTVEDKSKFDDLIAASDRITAGLSECLAAWRRAQRYLPSIRNEMGQVHSEKCRLLRSISSKLRDARDRCEKRRRVVKEFRRIEMSFDDVKKSVSTGTGYHHSSVLGTLEALITASRSLKTSELPEEYIFRLSTLEGGICDYSRQLVLENEAVFRAQAESVTIDKKLSDIVNLIKDLQHSDIDKSVATQVKNSMASVEKVLLRRSPSLSKKLRELIKLSETIELQGVCNSLSLGHLQSELKDLHAKCASGARNPNCPSDPASESQAASRRAPGAQRATNCRRGGKDSRQVDLAGGSEDSLTSGQQIEATGRVLLGSSPKRPNLAASWQSGSSLREDSHSAAGDRSTRQDHVTRGPREAVTKGAQGSGANPCQVPMPLSEQGSAALNAFKKVAFRGKSEPVIDAGNSPRNLPGTPVDTFLFPGTPCSSLQEQGFSPNVASIVAKLDLARLHLEPKVLRKAVRTRTQSINHWRLAPSEDSIDYPACPSPKPVSEVGQITRSNAPRLNAAEAVGGGNDSFFVHPNIQVDSSTPGKSAVTLNRTSALIFPPKYLKESNESQQTGSKDLHRIPDISNPQLDETLTEGNKRKIRSSNPEEKESKIPVAEPIPCSDFLLQATEEAEYKELLDNFGALIESAVGTCDFKVPVLSTAVKMSGTGKILTTSSNRDQEERPGGAIVVSGVSRKSVDPQEMSLPSVESKSVGIRQQHVSISSPIPEPKVAGRTETSSERCERKPLAPRVKQSSSLGLGTGPKSVIGSPEGEPQSSAGGVTQSPVTATARPGEDGPFSDNTPHAIAIPQHSDPLRKAEPGLKMSSPERDDQMRSREARGAGENKSSQLLELLSLAKQNVLSTADLGANQKEMLQTLRPLAEGLRAGRDVQPAGSENPSTEEGANVSNALSRIEGGIASLQHMLENLREEVIASRHQPDLQSAMRPLLELTDERLVAFSEHLKHALREHTNAGPLANRVEDSYAKLNNEHVFFRSGVSTPRSSGYNGDGAVNSTSSLIVNNGSRPEISGLHELREELPSERSNARQPNTKRASVSNHSDPMSTETLPQHCVLATNSSPGSDSGNQPAAEHTASDTEIVNTVTRSILELKSALYITHDHFPSLKSWVSNGFRERLESIQNQCKLINGEIPPQVREDIDLLVDSYREAQSAVRDLEDMWRFIHLRKASRKPKRLLRYIERIQEIRKLPFVHECLTMEVGHRLKLLHDQCKGSVQATWTPNPWLIGMTAAGAEESTDSGAGPAPPVVPRQLPVIAHRDRTASLTLEDLPAFLEFGSSDSTVAGASSAPPAQSAHAVPVPAPPQTEYMSEVENLIRRMLLKPLTARQAMKIYTRVANAVAYGDILQQTSDKRTAKRIQSKVETLQLAWNLLVNRNW